MALAERNGFIAPKDVYFPVFKSVHAFLNPKDPGHKKIVRLSNNDRDALKFFKPYKGGNNILYDLHHLDITRKHQRLVFVTNEAGVLVIAAHGLPAQVWTNTSRRLENNAELARGPGGEPDREVQITPEITFGDGEAVKGKPVVTALRDFGSLAATIIKTFDI